MEKHLKVASGQEVIVDYDLHDLLGSLRWHLIGKGYAATTIRGKNFALHHFVAGYPLNKLQVDHINQDKLDNRRSNLRILTNSQNQHNRSIDKRNRSGVQGVYWDKEAGRWRARVTLDYKKVHLGRFSSLEDAKQSIENWKKEVFKQVLSN